MSDPKLEAIQQLLSFLMQSETKRALPQEAKPDMVAVVGDKKKEEGKELPDDVLQGLSRIKDEDDMER